jgi:hypothetical protein
MTGRVLHQREKGEATKGGSPKKKKGRKSRKGLPAHRSGNDLLSHRVSPAVPSAQEGLTSEFGMGSGVTPPQ